VKGIHAAHTQMLSGRTEYVLVGAIPGQALCGRALTMTASTWPRAANGTVMATTMRDC
jgi:hypothetical protein